MSVNVVVHAGDFVSSPHVLVVGPILMFCWADERWHEYRVKADSREQYRLTQTQIVDELPAGATELPFLICDEALYWQETGPVPRYRRYVAGRNQGGTVVLKNDETTWCLPGGLQTRYNDGVGLRAGLYLYGADGVYHRYQPLPRASDGVIVLMDAARGARPPF